MTKKTTASKSSATSKKSVAPDSAASARKSSATRTKLPVTAEPAVIEAMAPPQEVVYAATPESAEVEAPSAPVEEVAETPVIIEAMAPPTRTVAPEELEAMTRVEALQRAERRGFRDGSAFEDWIRAEADVRARLVAEGATLATR